MHVDRNKSGQGITARQDASLRHDLRRERHRSDRLNLAGDKRSRRWVVAALLGLILVALLLATNPGLLHGLG